jgi:hypothetical protein
MTSDAQFKKYGRRNQDACERQFLLPFLRGFESCGEVFIAGYKIAFLMIKFVMQAACPYLIRKMGVIALTKELGPVGMVYFIQQFDRGEGDYTSERENLLADVTMGEVLRELKNIRRMPAQRQTNIMGILL